MTARDDLEKFMRPIIDDAVDDLIGRLRVRVSEGQTLSREDQGHMLDQLAKDRAALREALARQATREEVGDTPFDPYLGRIKITNAEKHQVSDDAVERAAVLQVCERVADVAADYALNGEPSNARNRESMEATATRIKHEVANLPAITNTNTEAVIGYAKRLSSSVQVDNGRWSVVVRFRTGVDANAFSEALAKLDGK